MAVAMGEGHAKLVEELVQGLLEFYGGRGELTGSGVAGEGGGEVEGAEHQGGGALPLPTSHSYSVSFAGI